MEGYIAVFHSSHSRTALWPIAFVLCCFMAPKAADPLEEGHFSGYTAEAAAAAERQGPGTSAPEGAGAGTAAPQEPTAPAAPAGGGSSGGGDQTKGTTTPPGSDPPISFFVNVEAVGEAAHTAFADSYGCPLDTTASSELAHLKEADCDSMVNNLSLAWGFKAKLKKALAIAGRR